MCLFHFHKDECFLFLYCMKIINFSNCQKNHYAGSLTTRKMAVHFRSTLPIPHVGHLEPIIFIHSKRSRGHSYSPMERKRKLLDYEFEAILREWKVSSDRRACLAPIMEPFSIKLNFNSLSLSRVFQSWNLKTIISNF